MANLFKTFAKVQAWQYEFTNGSYSHNEIWIKKEVSLAKLSIDQALLKAKSHAKKGEIAEAKKIYSTILNSYPKNIRAKEGLAALSIFFLELKA